MKVAILAGGFGTRLAEETEAQPKPMVDIGGRPILWHIMRYYAHFGYGEFVIALGYKAGSIKRWVSELAMLSGDLTIKTCNGDVKFHNIAETDWVVHLVETGLRTQTGGRIKRLAKWLGNETFMLTWGDGLSDVDLKKLLAFHKSHGKIATLTAVRPPARFGHLEFDGDAVCRFTEKPQTSEGWINGAFFVLEPAVFEYIEGDSIHFEHEPLERLASEGQLMAYKHDSFWQCMDTLREKRLLEKLWQSSNAPWKIWREA